MNGDRGDQSIDAAAFNLGPRGSMLIEVKATITRKINYS